MVWCMIGGSSIEMDIHRSIRRRRTSLSRLLLLLLLLLCIGNHISLRSREILHSSLLLMGMVVMVIVCDLIYRRSNML